MTKCVDCDLAADFYLDDPGANPLLLCKADMPEHLAARIAAGEFSLPVEEVAPVVKAVRAQKTADAPVEAAAVEVTTPVEIPAESAL